MNEQMALEMAIRARQQLAGMDATIRKIREMKQHFAGMANSIYSHARKVVAAVAKMQAAIKKLNNAFRTLRNVALKAFTAIVALNAIPIKFFADFEQKMANVNTLLDVSKQKFQQMGQGVISISNRLGESATSLATGLYDIVSAGVSAADSLNVLDMSARAAKAGMTDTQNAANAGLATINSYNLSISQLSRVFDLQFQTVRKGVITYQQLSAAQGQMLPSAKKLNESLENVYGSLAFITKNGLSADEASTSLARAFDGLAEKADKLAKYGVEVYDEFGKYRGILPIMEDLSEVMDGLSDKQMQDVLGNIGFDIRAARAIIPMITNIDGLRESILAMKASSGAMEEAFKKATDTIQFHFDRAKENVINAIRQMGSGWRTEINDLLDKISAWAGALQDFVADNKDAIKSIITFALKLAGIVALVGVIGTAIFALMTPIGAVVAGIGILGAAWYLNLWDIRGTTQKVVNYVLEKWDELKDWWKNTTWLEKGITIAQIPLKIAKWVWSSAVDIATSLWSWLKEKFDLDADGNLTLSEVFQVVVNIAKWIWNNIGKPVCESVRDWIKDYIDADNDGVITFDEAMEVALDITLVLGAVTAAFTAAALIKAILAALAAIGVTVVSAAAQAGAALAAGVAIGATLSVALDPEIKNYQEWKEKFIEGLKILFSKEFWRLMYGWAKAEWISLWIDATNWLENHFGKFFTKEYWLDVLGNLKNAWYDIWNDLKTSFQNFLDNPIEFLKNWHESNRERAGFASGGYISGPGTNTSDSIPAMLSNGEFVINAEATQKWLPLLEKINNGEMPGFAYGGSVDAGLATGANQLILQASGLGDNAVLQYLATIAQDTENFKHIIDLIAGIQQMKDEYQNRMKELQSLSDEYSKKLEKQLDDLNNNTKEQTKTFEASLQDLGGQLATFANNLANITGNEAWGVAGSAINGGLDFMNQFQNFGNAGGNLLGQLTAGFGMANAALGVVSAFKSWNDAQNQKAEQQWEEQMRLDEEQLENIKAIEENTRQTARDLVKILAENPTTSNIAKTQGLLEDMWGDLTKSLIPDFGKIAIKVKEKDLFFDDKKTKKYDPLALMRKMGYNVPGGSIGDLNYEQLDALYEQVKNVSSSDLKNVAEDIADSLDWDGHGELKSWESNWDSFKQKLKAYLETVKELEDAMTDLAQSARYESFEGVEWLSAQEQVEAYRKQLEELYQAAGKDINKYSGEIDAAVNAYADAVVDGGERIITIMQAVRQGFIDAFSSGDSAAESFAGGLASYFDTIKTNIASLFYDIEMDQLDAQFKEFFGDFIDELANFNPKTDGNVLDFAEQLLSGGDMQALFNSLIESYQILGDMSSINDILIQQFREAVEAAGLTAEEIDEMLNNLGLVDEEAQRVAENLQSALQSAMSTALDTDNLTDFRQSLGEAIYNSAKEGLIQAFMESEVYQEMFESWFENSDITFTGDLEKDFETMQDMLDDLYDQLKEAGLDFNYTEVVTEGNGSEETTGLYSDSDSYFAPSTLEAAQDMADTFADAIDEFIENISIITDTINSGIDKVVDSISESVSGLNSIVQTGITQIVNAIESTKEYMSSTSSTTIVAEGGLLRGGRVTVNETHYHYEPKNNKFYNKSDEELFLDFLKWKKQLEKDES